MKALPAAPLKLLFALLLGSCIVFVAIRTLHWPMLGDSSLMHYVVFLLEHGAAPYRDLYELNLPGAYWVEWSAMHLYGQGALGWRCFDLSLGVASIAAMMIITRPIGCFAGFWAGALLLLVHARDGIVEVGQRDFTMTVLLLVAYAALFTALRRDQPRLLLLFGLAAGVAATVKPAILPVGPMALLLVAIQLRNGRRLKNIIVSGAVGLAFPWLCVLIFLWKKHALQAFLYQTSEMISYHATLAHRGLGYLLLHSISPLMPLLLGWILVLSIERRPPGYAQIHLIVALFLGLLSYLVQAKGYSYQRYPVLAFLLVMMAVDLNAAWQRKRRLASSLAVATLAIGALWIAPASALDASRYDGGNLGTVGMLQQDLERLGKTRLAGGIQCIDSIDGCTNVLYRMRLKETSAVFYDEFLFGPGNVPAVRQNREKFWSDQQASPPEIVIVTDRLFPSGPDHYGKLALWPLLNETLEKNYTLSFERTPTSPVRWWSRSELPAGYRIYLRKDSAKP